MRWPALRRDFDAGTHFGVVRTSPQQGGIAYGGSDDLVGSVVVDALLPTALIHAGLLVFAVVAVTVFRPVELTRTDWLGIWNHWDGPHFLDIAAHGYLPTEAARIVLFPLLPLLIALGSLVFSPLAAAMIVAFAGTMLAAGGLYALVRLDGDRNTARLAVIAMNVFPTAYAFVAPYSESLFLGLVVWSLYFARTERWAGAGIAAALAGATRIQGAFLLPALAVEYLVSRRSRRGGRWGFDGRLLWLALGLLGPLAYLAINDRVFGDPFHFVEVQRTVFGVSNIAPWDALAGLLRGVAITTRGESWITVYVAPLAAFVVLAVATAWSIVGRESRASYAIYALITLVSLATLSWPISVPRYILGVFPIFILGGRLARNEWLAGALLAASVLLLGVFATLFVIGHWAF